MLRFGMFIVAILLLFSLSFYYIFWQNSYYNTKNSLYKVAEDIEAKIEDKSSFSTIKSRYPFAIVKKGVIYKSANFKQKYFNKVINLKSDFFYPKVPLEGEDSLFIYHVDSDSVDYIITVAPKIDNILERILTTLAILNPLLFLAFIFLLNSLIDSLLKPINQLIYDAKEVSIDNFKKSLASPKYNDEIAQLTDTFNKMLQRLKDGVERLKRTNDNIAHELKTPLTIMQTELELALNSNRDKSYYKESLESINKQVKKLNHISQTLLMLSRYGKMEVKKTFQVCDFNTIILNCIEDLKPKYEAKNIDIEIVKFEQAKKFLNYELVKSAIFNILDNAIKYSNSGGKIEISLIANDNKVKIVVQDWGIGISKDILPKITEEFFKNGNSSDSFGLGLYIVKSICTLLDGELLIESKEGEGSKFTLIL